MDEKVDQIVDKAGRLLLAEEDWLARNKHHFQSNFSKDSGTGGGGGSQGKGKSPVKPEGGASGGQGTVKLMSEGTPRRKGRCRNCGIYGHWAEECKRPKKERKQERRDGRFH